MTKLYLVWGYDSELQESILIIATLSYEKALKMHEGEKMRDGGNSLSTIEVVELEKYYGNRQLKVIK